MGTTVFEESESGQVLMRSVQFFQMALFVIEQEGYKYRVRVFHPPLLNTIAIGVELLLKHALIHSGKYTLESVKDKFRHDIMRMWKQCEAQGVVSEVLDYAEKTSLYLPPDAGPIEDPRKEFLDMLRCLGRVDKRDSPAGRVLIQDCFLRSSYGSRGFVGRGMEGDRAAAAA